LGRPEPQAQCRIADEYDAAQARGEVATGRDGPGAGILKGNTKAKVGDIGLSSKLVHAARLISVNAAQARGEVQNEMKDRQTTVPVAAR
jgi:hypothetical protein